MSFQISALDPDKFGHLIGMSDQDLQAAGAVRATVDKKPGFPCRITLQDAEPGEEVILVHYEHLPVDTPYRASHAVYVRPAAARAEPDVNEVPEMLQRRMLSLRAFTPAGMLMEADVVDGHEAGGTIERMLGDERIAFVHIHFAKPGCYAARADRVL
jgi:hypothetical protein